MVKESVSSNELLDLSDWIRFNGDIRLVPSIQGVYVMLLKNGAKFPDKLLGEPIFSFVKYKDANYRVLYVGKATVGLRKRINMHFFKNDASWSTFRKTLGSLFGMTKTYRIRSDGSEDLDKTRFSDEDEEKISAWMKENIILLYCSAKEKADCEKFEDAAIKELYPPLNIEKNLNSVNGYFVKQLKELRAE